MEFTVLDAPTRQVQYMIITRTSQPFQAEAIHVVAHARTYASQARSRSSHAGMRTDWRVGVLAIVADSAMDLDQQDSDCDWLRAQRGQDRRGRHQGKGARRSSHARSAVRQAPAQGLLPWGAKTYRHQACPR